MINVNLGFPYDATCDPSRRSVSHGYYLEHVLAFLRLSVFVIGFIILNVNLSPAAD